jgi:hypothetical protein
MSADVELIGIAVRDPAPADGSLDELERVLASLRA